MISGADYVIYAHHFSNDILSLVLEKLKRYYPDSLFVLTDQNKEHSFEFLFCSNQEEHEKFFNEDVPYNEGEHVQLLVTKRNGLEFDILVQKEVKSTSLISPPEDYEAKLVCNSMLMYTVVAPDLLEKSPFARALPTALIETLSI